jgi:DNA helicase HerA-like ATPase
MKFRLPHDGEHTAIMGRTGSGKTQFGAFTIAMKNLNIKPTVIVDYKGDDILNGITRAREIDYAVPHLPGLYIIHPRPDERDEMNNWLGRIWSAENVDLYFDEGYMLPDSSEHDWFGNLLVQGRSKGVSITTLSQRPVSINRRVFSEASHVAVFHLNDKRDMKTVSEFTPLGFIEWIPPEFGDVPRLPPYHPRWYNIKDDERFVLRPVPSGDEIISMIDKQLEPKRKWV